MRSILATLVAMLILPAYGSQVSRPASTLGVRTDSLLTKVAELRYTVAIGYPQITGSSATVDARAVAASNAAIRDSVRVLAESFRPTEAVPADAPDYQVTTVEGGMTDPFIGDDVFSSLLYVYAYSGGAHGIEESRGITIDLRSGSPVHVGDLFRPGSTWRSMLSTRVGSALVGQAAELRETTRSSARASLFPHGYDAAAMRTATFTLGPDSLMIHFDQCAVAPCSMSAFHVPVAYADLRAVLRPDGPVARIRR